jgi:hypothetical protein
MRDVPGLCLVALVSALAAGAAAVLVREAGSDAGREARSAEFQRLVGGLGFGPTTHLSPCPFGFDPRLSPGCELDQGPIPGGRHFCPCHAGSVFAFPTRKRGQDP